LFAQVASWLYAMEVILVGASTRCWEALEELPGWLPYGGGWPD
jgi:hypothetical protein